MIGISSRVFMTAKQSCWEFIVHGCWLIWFRCCFNIMFVCRIPLEIRKWETTILHIRQQITTTDATFTVELAGKTSLYCILTFTCMNEWHLIDIQPSLYHSMSHGPYPLTALDQNNSSQLLLRFYRTNCHQNWHISSQWPADAPTYSYFTIKYFQIHIRESEHLPPHP